MKVKITKPFIHAEQRYTLGKEFDLENDFATELLNVKMAEAVKEEKRETATKKKSETPESNA